VSTVVDWSQLLRPKWSELYAARRRQRNAASRLPELPNSFFGWIPIVHRITEDEVLASAGLDAYVVGAPFYVTRNVVLSAIATILLQIRHPVPLSSFLLRSRRHSTITLQI
jgi:hypothetical protein